MEPMLNHLLPFGLLMVRTMTFLAAAPLFGWKSLPRMVKVGISMIVTIFFAAITPMPDLSAFTGSQLGVLVLLLREAVLGIGLGLAISLVYNAVVVGGRIISVQMGLFEAGIIDPALGEGNQSVAMFMDMLFAVVFLMSGGHHLMLLLLNGSFGAFPVGEPIDVAAMAELVLDASSFMLLLGLKLAAPVLAGFFVLSVVLGVLSRVLPEMNVLMMSLPLRCGLGFVLTMAIMPLMQTVAEEMALWMSQLFPM